MTSKETTLDNFIIVVCPGAQNCEEDCCLHKKPHMKEDECESSCVVKDTVDPCRPVTKADKEMFIWVEAFKVVDKYG